MNYTNLIQDHLQEFIGTDKYTRRELSGGCHDLVVADDEETGLRVELEFYEVEAETTYSEDAVWDVYTKLTVSRLGVTVKNTEYFYDDEMERWMPNEAIAEALAEWVYSVTGLDVTIPGAETWTDLRLVGGSASWWAELTTPIVAAMSDDDVRAIERRNKELELEYA